MTLYKTMVDHNSIPSFEPHAVAFKEDLEKLVNYVPQRRNNYEKKVGRSVKMGKDLKHALHLCHLFHYLQNLLYVCKQQVILKMLWKR